MNTGALLSVVKDVVASLEFSRMSSAWIVAVYWPLANAEDGVNSRMFSAVRCVVPGIWPAAFLSCIEELDSKMGVAKCGMSVALMMETALRIVPVAGSTAVIVGPAWVWMIWW